MKKRKRSLARGSSLTKEKREFRPLQAFWVPATSAGQTICLTNDTPDGKVVTHYLFTDPDNPDTLESLSELEADLGQSLQLVSITPQDVLGALLGTEGNTFAENIDVIFIDDRVAIPLNRTGADFLVAVGDPKPWGMLNDEQLKQEAATLFALYVSKVEGLTIREVLKIAKGTALQDSVAPALAAMLAVPQPDEEGWIDGPPDPGSYLVKIQRAPEDPEAGLLVFDEHRTFAYLISAPLEKARLVREMGARTMIYYWSDVKRDNDKSTLVLTAQAIGQNW